MEYINQIATELQTGERETGLAPDEKETLDDAYDILTKLTILGSELHNKDLVIASQNLQDIIDEMIWK